MKKLLSFALLLVGIVFVVYLFNKDSIGLPTPVLVTEFPSAETAKVGDTIGAFTITSIKFLPSNIPNYPYPALSATLEGVAVITGTYSYSDWNGVCLDVVSGNLPRFKEFPDPRVCLFPYQKAFKEIVGEDYGSKGTATVLIKDYEMAFSSGKPSMGPTATLVEVISVEKESL